MMRVCDVEAAISHTETMVKETLDRMRRTETRLTTFMIEHGMTPPTQKVRRDDLTLVLPSIHTSLKDIIIAAAYPGRYAVWHGGHQIGYLDIWREGQGQAQATTMPSGKGVASPDANV